MSKVKSSISLIPNLITSMSLLCGFLSIKLSFESRILGIENWSLAGYLIILAAFFDSLDGRLARLTNTESDFGVQYDSLVDVVSFGVAPSCLAYNFFLYNINKIGIVICFIFLVCATLRLARFNVESNIKESNLGNFSGIPTPMSAIAVVTTIFVKLEFSSWDLSFLNSSIYNFLNNIFIGKWYIYLLSLVLISSALGMVSDLEYLSTKTLKLPKKYPFKFLVVFIILFTILIGIDFTMTLVLITFIYYSYGPIRYLFFKKPTNLREDEVFTSEDE